MKRSLKNSKVSRRISVGAAGVALAALIGAGSAVGTVNVFAQEDTAVTTEQIEENVTVTDQAPEPEQTGDAATALPDTAKDREENVAPEKTKAEDKTDAVNEDKKAEIISPAKTEERPETGGVGAVNTVEAVKNGWVKENGGYKYYKNGKAYTGWHKMGKAEGEKTPHWSYFGKNGVVYTGWRKMGKAEGEKTTHWSFFGSNGWLRTGWVQLGKGTANPDGNSAKHWSFFGDNGWLRTGWVQLGKGTANPDGNTAKHWSYFGGNGWLRTGWVQFGKGTSEPDGNVAKHWSFFGDNGWLRTELQSMGKGTSNPDGNSAKHLSYFGSNGWLRVSQNVTVNGKNYKADSKGWLKEIKPFGVKKTVRDIFNMTYGTFTDRYGDLGYYHQRSGYYKSDSNIPGTNYNVEYYQPPEDGVKPLTRNAYVTSVTAPLSDIIDGIENVSTVDELIKSLSSNGKAKSRIWNNNSGNWHNKPDLCVDTDGDGKYDFTLGFNDFNHKGTIPYIASNLIVEFWYQQ